ncbi:MAG: hypothetical protein MJE77_36315 [Proteobacteria bacterium]|nr:hypothetical protein [Pseudomonadota bacterium]
MEDERLQLTIQLERSDDELRVDYYDGNTQPLLEETAIVAWSSIGRDFLYQGRDGELGGLDGVNAALEVGDQDELIRYFTQGTLVEVGHLLFYALLGNSERWEPIIRALYGERGEPRPNPPRRSVRVRILTSCDELVDLPWRLAAWKGKFLAESGWTFEVVVRERAEPDIEFRAPCPILIVAPEIASKADLEPDEHIEALREALPVQFSDSYIHVVKTREQTRAAFRDKHPGVLYYFGHAEIRDRQVCMLFGDADSGVEAVSANDLKHLMDGHYPYLAYINACKSGAAGWHSAGYQLSPEVAVVIGNATTAWSQHAGLAAIAWLTRCLGDGHDPVIAAHAVDKHVSTRGFEWGMRTIHANYGEWRAESLARHGPPRPIGLRLDRERSRERAYSRVVSLVRDDNRRVQALISYASPSKRLDLSCRQLKDHLDDHASHVAHISWHEVSFPLERHNLHTELHHELAASLGASSGESIEFALRRSARGANLNDTTPVLWLSWGMQARAEISPDELATWAYFCSEVAQECPADIRLVTYLAIEIATEGDRDSEIDELVTGLSLDFVGDPKFSLELIPPLADLTPLDIANFLLDPINNTRCPRNLIKELSQNLYAATNGNYAQTIEWLERAEREGWFSLSSKLKAKRSA